MNRLSARAGLDGALAVCRNHREGLQDALDDLERRGLQPAHLHRPSREDRRLLDQFAYRFTRLQDDMGARLMPAVLRVLGEEVARMSAIDRFDRLEQLGWLPDAREWLRLRELRNTFTHEYRETPEERWARIRHATTAARRMLEILDGFEERITRLPKI